MIMRNRPMKKPNRTIKWILLAPVILIVSCTDLTENVNNQVTAENFFITDEEFISALGDAYGAPTQYGGNFAVYMLAEVPSDEVVVGQDLKSTRLNSSHVAYSFAVLCL